MYHTVSAFCVQNHWKECTHEAVILILNGLTYSDDFVLFLMLPNTTLIIPICACGTKGITTHEHTELKIHVLQTAVHHSTGCEKQHQPHP